MPTVLIGVSASLIGIYAISAAVICISLTKSEAECLSSLQEPFAFSFHEEGRVLRLLFIPFAFSFFPLLHCDPVIDLLESFTYARNELFNTICKYFPQVALCGFCYAEILFHVFEMIKILFVCIWVFLYFVSCLESSHLKSIKKFLLFLFKTWWFQFSPVKSLTHLEFILVWGVRYSSNLTLFILSRWLPRYGWVSNGPSFLTDLKFCVCQMLDSLTCLEPFEVLLCPFNLPVYSCTSIPLF